MTGRASASSTGVGILGSAHFLDVPGKPGEVEKEQVSLVQFVLDEQPVTEITPTMNLSGQSFRRNRESQIRAVHLNSSVTLRGGERIGSGTRQSSVFSANSEVWRLPLRNNSQPLRDGVLIETVRLRTAEASDLRVSYPLR